MAEVVLNGLGQPGSAKKISIILFLKTIFHGVAFITWVSVLAWGLYIWANITEKHQENIVLRDLKMLTACFFTNWNYVFQTMFLCLSLSHDILEWIDKQNTSLGNRIRYWKNVIFNGMVVPFTLFVTTMFWVVYAIDRELVFPKIYDEVVPWWFNHCVHTNITIMIVIETLLQARRQPTDEKIEQILYWLIAFAYAVVYYSIYYFTRRWLYQVFGVMTWWQVCLYQLLIWGSSYAFYKLHFPVNRLIHGSEDEVPGDKEIEEVKENQNGTNGVNKPGVNGTNGVSNGEFCNGNGVDKNGETKNGVEKNGTGDNGKVITDLKIPPFSTKSWSLKYRSTRNQFENSHL
ncbi:androgen-dependent TFPI-regulating protein-like isoform X2 [Epargyreus clarus]|uniref:androgen-dependent TFPI-regulating protein-like isoform X2 n=1 Tax=Epargyreus clarus TaxID=520877 RepID=UPI003C2F300D